MMVNIGYNDGYNSISTISTHVDKTMSLSKPPMTGNGKHTTYKKRGDDWGMVYGITLPKLCCFSHLGTGLNLLGEPILYSRYLKDLQ